MEHDANRIYWHSFAASFIKRREQAKQFKQTDRQTTRRTNASVRFSERCTESIQISHALTRHVALAISQLGADTARV